MKKTTKILLVLAAVVAMTIGAVSTVMAADDIIIATWDGNEKEGYTAKDADGKDIVNTWAKSGDSGRYYYFDKTGTMVTEEFISSDDNWYYVGEDGAMATGWMSFEDNDEDRDILFEVIDRINGKDLLDGSKNNPYGKEVWVYFEPSGSAVMDAWIESDSGMYYYMEDVVMVAGDYTYEIDEEIYGFAPDGHMYYGWTEIFYTAADTLEDPLNDGKKNSLGWTYYGEGAIMNDLGWEKIDGEWYYFVSSANSRFTSTTGSDCSVILQNTYVEKDSRNDFDADFYFDEKGHMVTGEKYIGKASFGIDDFLKANSATDLTNKKTAEYKFSLYFNTDGSKTNGLKEGKFYRGASGYTVYQIDAREYAADDTEIYFTKVLGEDAIKGASVKNAIVTKDGNYMYFDGNGNQVQSGIVKFSGLSVAIAGGNIVKINGDSQRVDGKKYNFSILNGILYVGDNAVAYGASTKSTESYTLKVVAPAGDELREEIAKKLNGKYLVGETVSYTVLTRKAVQFTDITAAGAIVDDYDVTYYTGKTKQDDLIGYTFNFVVTAIDDEAESDVVTLTIPTVPVNEVTYNGESKGFYAKGETVVLEASANKIFDSVANALTGTAITGLKYADNGEEDAAKLVTYRNKVTFTMPANAVTVKENDVAEAYKVVIKNKENINVVTAYDMYKVGEAVTVSSIDAKYNNFVIESIYTDTSKPAYIQATGTGSAVDAAEVYFNAINNNITVTIKATEGPVNNAITLTGLGTPVTYADGVTCDAITAVTAGAVVVIKNITVTDAQTVKVTYNSGTYSGYGLEDYKWDATKKELQFTMPAFEIKVELIAK